MNVIDFPKQEPKIFELIGPFEEYRVVLNGRQIPKLTGKKLADGTINLVVDNRFCGHFQDEESATQAAVLVAQALAIGQGYPHYAAESKDQPFAPIAMCIGSAETTP